MSNRLPPLHDIIFTQCLHFALSLLFSTTAHFSTSFSGMKKSHSQQIPGNYDFKTRFNSDEVLDAQPQL